jgi:antitoxin ParD1/3/4
MKACDVHVLWLPSFMRLTLPRLPPMVGGSCDNSKRETCMTITLRPEHEKAITQAIQSGAYQNPDEVIGRALEVLRGEDEWLHERKDEIAEKIERAFGQFERGEFFSADESQADMERRKTAWLNEQQR